MGVLKKRCKKAAKLPQDCAHQCGASSVSLLLPLGNLFHVSQTLTVTHFKPDAEQAYRSKNALKWNIFEQAEGTFIRPLSPKTVQ